MPPERHDDASRERLPRIALTPGEPAGIGLDIVLTLAQRQHDAELVALADPGALETRAKQLRLPLRLLPFDAAAPRTPQAPGTLFLDPVLLPAPVVPGRPHADNAPALLRALQYGAKRCMDGVFDALVTGPLHKSIINQAGIPFSGHTEYLAALTGTRLPVMMLATAELRVALMTTHLPLSKVPAAITPARLEGILRILDAELRGRMGLREPRLLVCGLNPHAGEAGHLGTEEEEIIEPVLRRLRSDGLHVVGPVPADTAFTPQRLAEADVVVAMFHDQGLPALKARAFGRAVNVTLGLPIIRTSVDHGTALDIAGSGRARADSLEAALRMAVSMAEHSR